MSTSNLSLGISPVSRLARARVSLEGLSTGDAFGQTFFNFENWNQDPDTVLPDAPWFWTDDTAMALSVYEILEKYEAINQDELGGAFAARYMHDKNRCYGAAMHDLLRKIANDADWRIATRTLFCGLWNIGDT